MSITGLVLCGGRSSRMGRDKAWLELEGKPMLLRQIERLEAAGCAEVLVSGPAGRDYEEFGKRLIPDSITNGGPLAGLCAGISAATHDLVLSVAVDLPNLGVEFLRWLVDGAENVDAVCPRSERGFEPLCAVYRRSVCRPILQRRLETRGLALQDFIREIEVAGRLRIVTPAEWERWGADLLRNWNDPGGAVSAAT